MRFIYYLLLLIIIFSSTAFKGISAQTNPPVYMTLVSHNEDNSNWTTYNFYKPKRDLLVQLANIVQSKGAVWSFQSDWKFLLGVMLFDTGGVVSNTNGKNLIKWMVEDKGIFCDPHSHEANGYNYADVAYLHQQLGIIPTNVVGGFLYDTIINGNNWENLENGIYGRMYPAYFWKPDILWGGGTPLHVNDPNPLGAWKPKSMSDFYTHDSTKHLLLLGHGCSNHIEDTSNIYYNTEILRNIVRLIDNGSLPDSGFYPAYSIFGVGNLNPAKVIKISQFLDSVNVLASSGKVQWKSLTQIYNIWNTTHYKRPYRIMCDDIPLTIKQISSVTPDRYYLSQNYPNPFNPKTRINFSLPERTFAEIKIYDIKGVLVEVLFSKELSAGSYTAEWDAGNKSSGIYFYTLNTDKFTQTAKMFLVK